MGRRKKSKWWHSQIATQADPERPKPDAARWLVKGDIIHKDDHFKSAGQFHPVSSTVGMGWHAQLPPMWRGPLPETPRFQPRESEIIVSTKHQEFLDLVEMAGFILPNQFKNWRRFFLDEKNFLAEAEHWLSLRLQGRYPKIEDDVDKGLMTKHGGGMPANHPRAYTPNYSREDDDDYWDAWQGWSTGGASSKWNTRWQDPVLPLTPKIQAPSGTCATEFVVL